MYNSTNEQIDNYYKNLLEANYQKYANKFNIENSIYESKEK